MTAVIPTTAVGVFRDPAQAAQAIEDLKRAGFRADQIGVAARHTEVRKAEVAGPKSMAPEGGAVGAVAGGTVGAVLGAVATGMIPGVGPIIAAGLLAGVVGGAAAGAVAGGVLGTLIGLGLSEEDARFYEAELHGGRTLVTVQAGDRYDAAVAILRNHGAYGKGKPLL
jgi:hypothetical protein